MGPLVLRPWSKFAGRIVPSINEGPIRSFVTDSSSFSTGISFSMRSDQTRALFLLEEANGVLVVV